MPSKLTCRAFEQKRCRSCSELALGHSPRSGEKQERLLRAFEHALGYLPETRVPIFVPESIFPSRTKAKFSVSGTAEAPIIGLLGEHFSGVELLDCPLHFPLINQMVAFLPQVIREYKLTPYDVSSRKGELKGLILKCTADEKKLILRFVLRSSEAVLRIQKAIAKIQARFPQAEVISVNLQPIPHAILEGAEERVLTPARFIVEDYGDFSLHFAPPSFSQVSFQTAQALYRYVRDRVRATGLRHWWDLYCGVGGFSLACAPFVDSMRGVEATGASIEMARLGSQSHPHLRFEVGDADVFVENSREVPQGVVINPPKRGLSEKLIASLESKKPEVILYSSCNPESLMRDLRSFKSYRVVSIAPFEMFPLTEHLEVVAELRRV